MKLSGHSKYLYRAVDKTGFTVYFLLRARRNYAVVRAFLERAIELHDLPEKVGVDKSGSNKAAIVIIQADTSLDIALRQSEYLNVIVEQDHSAVKRVTRPMRGFKNFRCARIVIAGSETMPMIRKRRLADIKDRALSAANQFYSLAF